MKFYDEYFKKSSKEATEYKIEYLKSIIKENTIYKFIQFNEVLHLNNIKLKAFKDENLWFSYYRYLNDKTEFEINYDVMEISAKTKRSSQSVKYLFDLMVELYDICSFTYEYHDYMWVEYANCGNGICLQFTVDELDYLYPIEYIEKDTINFTELIIQSLNKPAYEFEYHDPMALLPFVVKDPFNEMLDSTKEKEVRILYSPFDKAECNQGVIAPNIKTDVGHKGICVNYADIGLKLKRIILGDKCSNYIVNEVSKYCNNNNISVTYK